jgi:2-polyprenyl-3-methyl-5-hydroxy-6-metoxy-1,4-benzoquinol methylase
VGTEAGSRPYFEIVNPEIVNILRGFPRGLNVLDVGCGSGLHGDVLKRELGHVVTGVDNSTVSIEKARTRLARAFIGDVTKPGEYSLASKDEKFDLILFSDILEHLYDPKQVLVEHTKLLKPGGHVVVSIPNIAIWQARLTILLGRFTYHDTGTFDRTHIRFFTRRTISELLAGAGLEQLRRRISPGISRPLVPFVKQLYAKAGAIDQQPDSPSIMNSEPYRQYMRWLYPAERLLCRMWPTLLAFQFIVLARYTEAVKEE